jgi:transketolase
MLETKDLRVVYCDCLIDLAEHDDRIVLLEADLMRAAGTIPFKEKFPRRIIDVGVAEANMIGVAAGLSAYGKIPFAHSFFTFASRRCYDQTAVSVAYAQLNVKIGGMDPGVAAELNGGTHMAFEDVGIMRNIPTMTVFEPVDAVQLKKAMPQIVEHYGPVYIRLFRRKAEPIFDETYDFKLGRADTIKDGKDVVIFASGLMVHQSLQAAQILEKEGVSARVVNIHTIKPLDADAVIAHAKATGAVVTAENHSIIGGLGSAVAETLSESCPVPMQRVGVRDCFGEVGKLNYLMERFRLTAGDVVAATRTVLAKKG